MATVAFDGLTFPTISIDRTPTVEPSVGATIDRPTSGGPLGVLAQPAATAQASPRTASRVAFPIRRFIRELLPLRLPGERDGVSAAGGASQTLGRAGWTEAGGAD